MAGKFTPILLILALAGSAISLSGSRLLAFAEPALVTKSWQLEFTFQDPRPIAVRGIDRRVRWYWYIPYKIVNNSGQEQFFVPEFTVATNRGDIITAGRGIPPHVFTAVKKQLGNRLLENPLQISGRILLGEDHAKESVAIWPVFEHDVDYLSIFVAGLSGESAIIKHPLTGKDVPLRKTMMLNYHTPGSRAPSVNPQEQTVRLLKKTWVMR
jgi:hypothetical protein